MLWILNHDVTLGRVTAIKSPLEKQYYSLGQSPCHLDARLADITSALHLNRSGCSG